MKPNVTRTCKDQDGATIDTCLKADGKTYVDSVRTVLVDDGNPFETKLYTWNEGANTFDVERQESTKTTGKCDFLEIEQLQTAYKCCNKKKGKNSLVTYYESKAGIKEKDAATLNRKVALQAF